VVSTVLDPDGKAVGKAVTATVEISPVSEAACQQQIPVSGPRLWSLEERNLYTLVSEVRVAARLSIATNALRHPFHQMDPSQGLLLNGSGQGERNLQPPGSRGVGAALPDAVQYYACASSRRWLQRMRTSHNPQRRSC